MAMQSASTEDEHTVTASAHNNGSTSQAIQTCQQPQSDIGTEALMPELVIENIMHSNDLIMFNTGLPYIKVHRHWKSNH